MLDNILENLNRKIGNTTGLHHLRVSLWGNDIDDSFQYNFDYQNYSESFESIEESLFQPSEIILIVGPINFNQIRKIMDKLEDDNSLIKLVVHARGSIGQSLLSQSYATVPDIRKFVKVDLEYTKYPLDIGEILEQIIELKEGHRAS